METTFFQASALIGVCTWINNQFNLIFSWTSDRMGVVAGLERDRGHGGFGFGVW